MTEMSQPLVRATYADALRAALGRAAPRPAVVVPLADAIGTTLAERIVSDRDQPPFDRAQMDGYALRHADLRLADPIPVHATVPAGTMLDHALPPETCVAIATGAPLPDGADTVVPHELTDRADPVRIRESVAPGHAVHRRGADLKQGATVVEAGAWIDARVAAAAAAVGAAAVRVLPKPRVAILTSGDEVVDVAATPSSAEIRNSNAIMLVATLRAFGAEVGDVRHLRDDHDETVEALSAALASHDLVVTVGGISAGDRDRFVSAIADLATGDGDRPAVRTLVRGVRLRPGGPLTVATAEQAPGASHPALLLGLPGNPVSALVCAHLFGWPIVRALAGQEPVLPWQHAALAAPMRTHADRQLFRPCRFDRRGAVDVTPWSGSGDLMHTIATDGIVELPAADGDAPVGTAVRVLPWADRRSAADGGMPR